MNDIDLVRAALVDHEAEEREAFERIAEWVRRAKAAIRELTQGGAPENRIDNSSA